MTQIITPDGFPAAQTFTIKDDCYPSQLKKIPDAPQTLFLTSASAPGEVFGTRPTVAIVGTRNPSPYGNYVVTRIIDVLSQLQPRPLVISGLAIGIDHWAHHFALKAGLPTLAVMPVGPDDIYPRQHLALAQEIANTPGCGLLTDFPAKTQPQAFNFLSRNRIIAGLAKTVIVVESKTRGGAVVTARLASDYGRDVLAVPGRIDDIRSAGCNELIREGVAEMLDDIYRLPAFQ